MRETTEKNAVPVKEIYRPRRGKSGTHDRLLVIAIAQRSDGATEFPWKQRTGASVPVVSPCRANVPAFFDTSAMAQTHRSAQQKVPVVEIP